MYLGLSLPGANRFNEIGPASETSPALTLEQTRAEFCTSLIVEVNAAGSFKRMGVAVDEALYSKTWKREFES